METILDIIKEETKQRLSNRTRLEAMVADKDIVDESGRKFITGLLRGQVEEQKQKSQVDIQDMNRLMTARMKDIENTT